MRYPRFSRKKDLPPKMFFAVVFIVYVIGGLIAVLIGYLTRDWK